MISIIQIFSVIFGIFMLYMARIHRKKRVLDRNEIFFWNALWLGFIYVAFFPQTFRGLIQRLQIARVFDLLVIVAFMIITFITFQNRITIKNLGKKLEEIVRRRALYEAKEKTTKN